MLYLFTSSVNGRPYVSAERHCGHPLIQLTVSNDKKINSLMINE